VTSQYLLQYTNHSTQSRLYTAIINSGKQNVQKQFGQTNATEELPFPLFKHTYTHIEANSLPWLDYSATWNSKTKSSFNSMDSLCNYCQFGGKYKRFYKFQISRENFVPDIHFKELMWHISFLNIIPYTIALKETNFCSCSENHFTTLLAKQHGDLQNLTWE